MLTQKNAKFVLKAIQRHPNSTTVDASTVVNTSIEDLAVALYNNEHLPEVSFDVEVLDTKENILYINSIHAQDKLVVFEGTEERVRVDLWVCIEDKPPLIYQDIIIERGYDFDSTHHNYLILRPTQNPKIVNKRNSFRVKVGIPCHIQLGDHKGVVEGMLKDVSTEGFAIEVAKDKVSNAIPHKDMISLVFSDVKISNTLIKVNGLCVRKVDLDDKILYGVHAPIVDKTYKTYVMNKQTNKCRA